MQILVEHAFASPPASPADAATQDPALHVWPVTVQSLQTAPRMPQDVFWMPALQPPAKSQHPGQEVAQGVKAPSGPSALASLPVAASGAASALPPS
jgi:hypothetical protein